MYEIIELAMLLLLAVVVAFAIWRAGKRTAWRRLAQAYPKCIRCGYAMKGLTEARCPECGARYTLDELWIGQRDLPTEYERDLDI